MAMQHFFASLKPVEWMSILVSISVTLLFCWWICFGFKGRSTSILAGIIYLTRHRWSGKLHSTQIVSWEETNTFYENARFVDLFFILIRHPIVIAPRLWSPRSSYIFCGMGYRSWLKRANGNSLP